MRHHTDTNVDPLSIASGVIRSISHLDIEAQRNIAQTVIFQLSGHINTLSPISHLPDEVLSHIFLIHRNGCSAPNAGHRVGNGKEEKPYIYARVSHVCHHWRKIALSTALLWNRVFTGTKELWAQTLLQRSSGAHLTLETTHTTPYDILFKFPHIIRPHLDRVHEISLRTSLRALEETPATWNVFRSLRALRALRFEEVRDGWHSWSDGSTLEEASGSVAEFGLLQKYQVRGNCSRILKAIPILDAVSETLTTLILRNVVARGATDASHEPELFLLSILRRLPLLITLEVEQARIAFEESQEGTDESANVVCLPRLANLGLKFMHIFTEDYTWLLEHLSFPPTTKIEICQGSNGGSGLVPQPGVVSRFFDALSSKLSSPQPPRQPSNVAILHHSYPVPMYQLRIFLHKSLLYAGDARRVRIRAWRESPRPMHSPEDLRLDFFWDDEEFFVTPPSMPDFVGDLFPFHSLPVDILEISRPAIIFRGPNSGADTSDKALGALRKMRHLRALVLDEWTEEEVALLLCGSDADISRTCSVARGRKKTLAKTLRQEKVLDEGWNEVLARASGINDGEVAGEVSVRQPPSLPGDLPFPHLEHLRLMRFLPYDRPINTSVDEDTVVTDATHHLDLGDKTGQPDCDSSEHQFIPQWTLHRALKMRERTLSGFRLGTLVVRMEGGDRGGGVLRDNHQSILQGIRARFQPHVRSELIVELKNERI